MPNKPVAARTIDPTMLARVERALAGNDITGAAALAETLLDKGQVHPMLLNLAAWRREEAGDYAGAHLLLRQALSLAPGDVLVLGAIGTVLRKEGRVEEALEVLDQVVAAEPRHAAAWLERGYALSALRSDKQAQTSYERAVAIDTQLAPAWGKLADAAAKAGDADRGRALAARALVINPGEPAAVCALATIDLEARDGAAAEARLRTLLDAGVSGDDRTRSMTLLGDALDRQDRTAEAFAVYREAQHNFRLLYAPTLAPTAERPSHRRFVERIREQVRASPATPAPSAEPVPGAAARHVFLLGYPRSGTTLVENVLASAPDVVALEERDTLADTDEVLVRNDGTMPDLDAITPSLLADLRAGYWRRVQAMAGAVEGKTFVDMNPFNGIKLPIIAQLFPDARILIMRRDPRDVVLSCFRINFTPSTAAWSFSDLEETARHYAALMTLTEACREHLPLACHEVRYDRLVVDFEDTVRAMADFIGIAWNEAFRRFDRTAQTRGVRTASATQVRRGLYDGRGQWRRYEAELAPALPILQPWIERFGYQA
ncbi:tetratricopeptide repeat-containing sulfotransferase family protein [uncultured Sphingomonas sp.]|uniref:tetratricopeptide repeat-containing sulfotransferase family protein n=1 Tax=uncultured Sphingomonas sp. TaxID=158754 RepID=UPI0025D1092D|nr:tetratricopeptide repeat-containing sulfotransferase family protein [uncultured Sphingomonas sp.]